MSSASISQESQFGLSNMQCDSLLEHLYTNFGVNELREMLINPPDDVILKTWNVSVEDFEANVQSAIECVMRD